MSSNQSPPLRLITCNPMKHRSIYILLHPEVNPKHDNNKTVWNSIGRFPGRGGLEHWGIMDCCLIWTEINIKREICTKIHQHIHPSKVTIMKTDMKGFVIKTFALKLWTSEPSHMTILVEWPLEDRYEGIDHKKLILLLHKEKCTSHNWKTPIITLITACYLEHMKSITISNNKLPPHEHNHNWNAPPINEMHSHMEMHIP
jgi:hypothetical protein